MEGHEDNESEHNLRREGTLALPTLPGLVEHGFYGVLSAAVVDVDR
jgi:hypothetical protein